MELFMQCVRAFGVGGVLCAAGQLLLMKTGMSAARILVLYVTLGVGLTAAGIYGPLVEFAQSGATVPLLGFGYALVQGAFKAVDEIGILGAFTGGMTATAGGVAAAIVFGYLNALVFTPGMKE